jgi:peptidoglycan/xylan/chitin deacetylase (PgdA/CDA1 family)
MEQKLWIGLALGAAVLGVGGAIASRVLKRPSLPPTVRNVPPASVPPTLTNASLCDFNALDRVTDSLQQVRTVNALGHDPLTVLAAARPWLTPELLASLSPAPFPQISDRARTSAVPVIMYHDITPVKDVDWDVTPQEFQQHLALIRERGLTPISMDQLVSHLQTGSPLPEKPILLTFDDNYLGQYQHAFPLLKKYNYPAVWSVHTAFVGSPAGKPKATWEQLREMQRSGLITIASHTVNHLNLAGITDTAKIDRELQESKSILEKELGVPVIYFTYPEGDYSPLVRERLKVAGYRAALSMSLDPAREVPANQSEDMLTIMRYGQSRFAEVIAKASGGNQLQPLSFLPGPQRAITYQEPIRQRRVTIDGLPLTLVSGGRPVTAHADSRYQVEQIKAKYVPEAIAAVDGGFHSLEFLDSNRMIGPVVSQFSDQPGQFFIGTKGENPLLNGRPLVLISPTTVRFVPFDAKKHDSLAALQAELPDVTDAFVAAGWLVRDGKPQTAASFGKLYGFDANRDRAFWGIDRQGRPVLGVTMEMIDSVGLGQILAKAGLQEVVMLDSGASTALAYRGKSVMSYEPRPIPHIVALLPPVAPPPAAETPDRVVCPVSQR